MIDKYRLDDLRLESGEKGELARWVIQLQKDLDYERRKVSAPTALAAMDAEPYGYVHKAIYESMGSCGLSNDHDAHRHSLSHIAVYTAPPAPVVNAEPVADVVAWSKEGEERTCDIRWRRFDVAPGPLFAVAQPVAVVPDEMAISDDMNLYQKSFAQGHNACRAAMLQADNSPVIPGGWKQWVSDVIDYLENGLEADGELEAQGSIDAKRLLAAAPQQEVNRE